MLRHAVVYQLVLLLLAGPLLCCCATARAGTHTPAGSPAKSCCGHAPKPTPTERTPAAPAKCPCKDAAAKAVVTPETGSGSFDLSNLPPAVPAAFDRPVSFVSLRPDADSVCRAHSLSTADLLFAHHNLRC